MASGLPEVAAALTTMNRARAHVAGLVLWSANPETQERYPRVCSGIANLRDALQAETPRAYALRIGARYGRRRRPAPASQRRPTVYGRPAAASHRRPTAYGFDPFQAIEAEDQESGRTRQQHCRIRREVVRLRAEVANFRRTKTLGGGCPMSGSGE